MPDEVSFDGSMFKTLTDGQETVFQGTRCLGLDGLHDVLAGKILVLFENGSELRIGTSGQNRIERRFVCSPLGFTWKTEPVVGCLRYLWYLWGYHIYGVNRKLYLHRSKIERPRRQHCDRLPRLPRGSPGKKKMTHLIYYLRLDNRG